MECNVSISCPLSPTTDVQYVVAVEFVSFVFERRHNNWITATTTSIKTSTTPAATAARTVATTTISTTTTML